MIGSPTIWGAALKDRSIRKLRNINLNTNSTISHTIVNWGNSTWSYFKTYSWPMTAEKGRSSFLKELLYKELPNPRSHPWIYVHISNTEQIWYSVYVCMCMHTCTNMSMLCGCVWLHMHAYNYYMRNFINLGRAWKLQ